MIIAVLYQTSSYDNPICHTNSCVIRHQTKTGCRALTATGAELRASHFIYPGGRMTQGNANKHLAQGIGVNCWYSLP
jgi:hypothetical protein